MSKIKKLVYSLAVMVFVVVALSSCDKSMDEPVVPQQNEQLTQAAPETETLRVTARGWSSVKDLYKNRYRSAYNKAVGTSFNNVKKYFISIGFFTAINAVEGTSFKDLGVYELKDLVQYNSSYAWFGDQSKLGYSDERIFKRDIKRFVSNKQKPVVVYAETDAWYSNNNKDKNILIVWEVSDSGVKVTKISNTPASSFSNNSLIELSWSDLLQKAKNLSSYGVANVVYPDKNPHDL